MGWGSQKNRRRVADEAQRRSHFRATAGLWGRLLLGVCLTLGASGMASGAYAWASTTPAFGLKNLTYRGLSRASQAELTRLSGLVAGQNVLDLDTFSVVRAMASHPWVKRVNVTRHLPGGLSIEVEEHVPAAVVSLGELYFVDAEGRPFKRVEPNEKVDLPLITGVDRDAYVARADAAAARMRNALEVARAYGKKRVRLTEIRLSGDHVTLVNARGQQIRMGEGRVAEKLQRLDRVQAELSRKNATAEVIHLDNRSRPEWVAVKLSSAVAGR